MYGSPRKTRAINIVSVPAQALSKMSELQAHHPTTFGHTRRARQAVGASLLMGFKGCGGSSIGTRIGADGPAQGRRTHLAALRCARSKSAAPFDGALTWASASAAGSHFPGLVSQSEQERSYDVHRRAGRDAEPFKTWSADHYRTARLGAFVALADEALGGRADPRPGHNRP